MEEHFDVAVVGNGLMGASASRYLSEMGLRVAAIGPGEPMDWKAHQGVFASHYDEARITRMVDPDKVWSTLAARAIASYAEIEERSGITFHHRAGCLRVSPYKGQAGDSLLRAAQNGVDNGAQVEMLDADGLREHFPYLSFGPNADAIWETGDAGYINPRALIAAQLQMAMAAGAALVREEVTRIDGADEGVRLATDKGAVYGADRVLIAAGSFANHLLPRPIALHPRVSTILLAELDAEEYARLRECPSIIWRLENHPVLYSIYSLPPVRYPDGKTYFKIGGQLQLPNHRYSRDGLIDWFHSDGNSEEVEALSGVLHKMIPGLRAQSTQTKPCVVGFTSHDRPYIDSLDDILGDRNRAPGRLFLASGPDAAKSSVEIGQLAAKMVAAGAWDDDLPDEWFRIC